MRLGLVSSVYLTLFTRALANVAGATKQLRTAGVESPGPGSVRGGSMAEVTDPTFYRSPAEAIAAPPEELAYVVAFDPAGAQHDAMTVVDCNAESSSYGRVVGSTELPHAGNEVHHFGWNACSSALCHQGHAHHGALERRYLVVPGLRSSRTYVLDTKPDPRQPQVVRTIDADELAAKAGYSRPHTVHCGPGGIFRRSSPTSICRSTTAGCTSPASEPVS
jgi:56kDa selenium binding protein (SBP56)